MTQTLSIDCTYVTILWIFSPFLQCSEHGGNYMFLLKCYKFKVFHLTIDILVVEPRKKSRPFKYSCTFKLRNDQLLPLL